MRDRAVSPKRDKSGLAGWRPPKRLVAYGVVGLVCVMALGACGGASRQPEAFLPGTDGYVLPDESFAVQVAVRAPGQDAEESDAQAIYAQGWGALESGEVQRAADLFFSLQDTYPHAKLASKAQLMAAYALFELGHYDRAAAELERFVGLHPANEDTAYAYYLKGVSQYRLVPGVGRDPSLTMRALDALEQVPRRFPDSRLALDAEQKAAVLRNILAANHLSIGRYYQLEGRYLAALGRFRIVATQYHATDYAPEALHRLGECYAALGVVDEAAAAFSRLARDFPGSEWAAYRGGVRSSAYAVLPSGPWPARVEDGIEVAAADATEPIGANGDPGARPATRRAGWANAGTGLLDRPEGRSEVAAGGEDHFAFAYQGPRLSFSAEGDGQSMSDVGADRPSDPVGSSRFSWSGEASVFETSRLKLWGDVVERWDRGGTEVAGFTFGDGNGGDRWKRGRTEDTHVLFGLLENRLRLTTHFSASRYADHTSPGQLLGQGIVQRFDADLLKSDEFRLALFGGYAGVESTYRGAEAFDRNRHKSKKKNDDPFANPGRQEILLGSSLGLGPVDLSLVQSVHSAFDNDKDESRDTGYEATVSLNLDAIQERVITLLGIDGTAWRILPGSVWVSYGRTAFQPDNTGELPEDRTTDASLGASWYWDSGSADVSYWRSFYDSRQEWMEDADWSGDGIDVGVGQYGSNWSVYGSLSMYRSNSFGLWTESVETGYSTWVTFAFQPEYLPDVSATLGMDLYRGDYIAWNGNTLSLDRSATAELDFSKYLVGGPWGFYDPSMKLVLRLERSDVVDEWDGIPTEEGDVDFFVGLSFALTAAQ